jgi:superfamily II DNA or RNA helicase
MSSNDTKKILVASYGTLSTGVSIKSISHVVFADSFKSESLIIQSIGRALRLFDGKVIATIWDIVDVLDINQMNNTFYRQFEERQRFYIKRKYPHDIVKINL